MSSAHTSGRGSRVGSNTGSPAWSAAQNTDVVPGSETHVIDDQGRMHAVSYRSGDLTDQN